MSSLAITLGNYDIKDALDDKTFNYNICNMYLLDNQDLSDTTIKAYKTYLNQFVLWLKANNITQPTEDTIKAYKLYLKDNNNYTIATINQYIRAVKHLFKWLNSRDLYKDISANIKELRDVRKHKRDSLTINEVNKIVNDIKGVSEIDLRDKAIIILASTLGLRANEIVNINISDIEQKDNIYIVNILGKGYKEKTAKKVIPKQVYLAIKDYLDIKKGVKPSDALFTSTSNRALNKRLTKETLSQIVKNRYRASGFNSSKLTLHSLRHLTADATLKASDNNIYKTQHCLRHKNTQTTEIYLSEQEDIDVSLANDVYNTIFNADAIDKTRELRDAINTLETSDVDKVLSYIRDIKG
jgi:site-specific recombinase XerD